MIQPTVLKLPRQPIVNQPVVVVIKELVAIFIVEYAMPVGASQPIVGHAHLLTCRGLRTIGCRHCVDNGFHPGLAPLRREQSVMVAHYAAAVTKLPRVRHAFTHGIMYVERTSGICALRRKSEIGRNIRVPKANLLAPCRPGMIRIDSLDTHIVSSDRPRAQVQALFKAAAGVTVHKVAASTVGQRMPVNHVTASRRRANSHRIGQILAARLHVGSLAP